MKLVGAISTAVLSLTLGVGIPAYAQQQHDQQEEKEKPAQEKEKKAKPEKPAKQEDKNARQEGKNARQEDKNTKPEERNAERENNNKQEKSVQEQHTQEAKPGRQDEHARGNGGRGRIPDDRYRANFGQEHRFRVNQSDYNNRRFQYGGYWFGFEGSWPSNWLYTEEVFVVEIDGVYYLCNANYPGVNIELVVAM